MAAERYRLGDVDWLDLGEGRQAVASRRAGRQVQLSAKCLEIVAGCNRYLTLEEHALRWARLSESGAIRQVAGKAPAPLQRWITRAAAAMKPSKGELEAAREHLRTLTAAEVLVSESSFIASLKSHPALTPAKISRVGFPTRKRPEALRRAVASYCENGRAFGRSFEFVIVDDSRDAASEETTRALLGELRSEYGFTMRFAGSAEREAFALKLAQRAEVDLQLVRFAVLGDGKYPLTTGSVRNCVLLDCVGEPLLMGDDDGVCRTATWPDRPGELRFSSLADPTLFDFFESREQTMAAAPFGEIDLLGAHETLLGHSAGALLAERRGPPDLDTISPRTEDRMRRAGGRVLATMAGVVGDSGIGSSAYLDINVDSARRVATTEEFYRAAVASRQVIRAAPQETIGDFALCMSGNLAVDTRELPPLFTPVLRNSDGVFGRLLKNCHPAAYSGAIPYAVMHDPLEERSYSFDAWKEDAAHIRYADVLLLIVSAWMPNPRPATSLEAYDRLSAHLLERTATTEGLQAELHRLAQRRGELAAKRLRRAEPVAFPKFYERLKSESAELTAEYSARPEYVVPRDIRRVAGSEEEAAVQSRELTERVARLWAAWPRLWQAAEELAREGVRLTTPL